jgi:hypothetical protein
MNRVSTVFFLALLTFSMIPSTIASLTVGEIEALRAIRTFFGYPWTDSEIEQLCQSPGIQPLLFATLSCSEVENDGLHMTKMYVRSECLILTRVLGLIKRLPRTGVWSSQFRLAVPSAFLHPKATPVFLPEDFEQFA